MEGEQQVTLQIVDIEHIEHDIDFALAEFAHHVGFLGRIGVETVSAGEVDKSQGAPLKGGLSHHARHRDAGIVARAFVTAGSGIKHGGFSTIRVAHKGDGQGAISLRT